MHVFGVTVHALVIQCIVVVLLCIESCTGFTVHVLVLHLHVLVLQLHIHYSTFSGVTVHTVHKLVYKTACTGVAVHVCT